MTSDIIFLPIWMNWALINFYFKHRYCCTLTSFPGPHPASHCLQYDKALPYCKQREAGRGPGNEASCTYKCGKYSATVARLIPKCIYLSAYGSDCKLHSYHVQYTGTALMQTPLGPRDTSKVSSFLIWGERVCLVIGKFFLGAVILPNMSHKTLCSQTLTGKG